MAAANPIVQPQDAEGGPMATLNTNQPPLRRAIYVHIADLTSPYNIDQSQLESELERAREEHERPVESGSGIPSELDTTVAQKRLQPPRGGYNLCVLVGRVEIVVDKNRVDGSRVRLAEVEVGDETGCVSLRARDDQIDILQQISSASGAVVLRNCTLELYQGKHIRLAVTKWGKLSRYPDQVASTPPPPEKINKERNFSFIDLNRVASSVASFRDPYGATETEGRQPQQQHHHQSSGGRTQSYGQSPNQGRRGGSRRSSRGNKPSGSQQSMPVPPPPQQHYTDRYPGGLHGYGTGFVDNSVMDPQQYSYNVRQQERHQHMMMQHQYEMQHRQMQHMYHQPQQTQHQQQQQQDPSRSSPMLVPGISSPPSFDGSSFGPEVPMAMAGANPFLYSQQQQQQQQRPNLMQQPQEPRSHESTPPATPQNATPPETPGMNPQAATFDPSPPPGPK